MILVAYIIGGVFAFIGFISILECGFGIGNILQNWTSLQGRLSNIDAKIAMYTEEVQTLSDQHNKVIQTVATGNSNINHDTPYASLIKALMEARSIVVDAKREKINLEREKYIMENGIISGKVIRRVFPQLQDNRYDDVN